MIGQLMARIAEVLREGGDWCDLAKAQALAALVVGLRPRVVCEVGVWTGGSMIPMLLALRAVEEVEGAAGAAPLSPRRKAVAVDAWARDASVAGQVGADLAWWAEVDHDAALHAFLGRVETHGLGSWCDVVRAPSDKAPVPDGIELLHLDGNHGEQAVRDVERFGAAVPTGGVLVLDDLDWEGGHVLRARDRAVELGFAERYPLGTGCVMQRVR